MTIHSRNLCGLCLLGALVAAAPAFAEKPAPKASAPSPEAKYYQPPQTLRNADGLQEFGLVDPFSRGPRIAAASPESGDPTLLRTTMGQLDDGFRILGIAVPEGTQKPAALIQLEKDAEPTLVHEGDLVRVERKKEDYRGRYQQKSAIESALDRYTFYIHVKKISATGLEVYYNKKRPDDTIILRW